MYLEQKKKNNYELQFTQTCKETNEDACYCNNIKPHLSHFEIPQFSTM